MRKVSNKVQPIKKPKQRPKKAPPKTKSKSAERLLYEKYLRSEQFKQVKEIVHKRDGERCQFCNRSIEECVDLRTTLQVHHRSYEHLGCGGEVEANDCILLCGICHRGAHLAKSNLSRFIDKHPIMENWKRE